MNQKGIEPEAEGKKHSIRSKILWIRVFKLGLWRNLFRKVVPNGL